MQKKVKRQITTLLITSLSLLVLTSLLLLHYGCTTMNLQYPKTPEDRLYLAQSLYNSAFDDYQIQASQPDLTPQMRQLLTKKKQFLTDAYTTISLYRSYVLSNTTPTPELERQLFDLINKLQNQSTR